MKDIMSKLAELESTAPKVTKKKMLNEDSTTPPMNISNKPASFKDVFESMASQKPIPVVGKQGDTQQTGAGFLNVTDNSPAAQALSNALGDLANQKKVQIVVPTQPGQPNQAGATGQPQQGQMQMKEKDEGKPGKNFAKIAKSAAKRYGSKEAGERVAGAVRAKLAKQGKLEEVDMGQAEKGLRKSTTHKGGYHVVDKAGKVVSKHDNQRDAMQAALKHDDHKVKPIKEEQLDEKFASQQQAKLMYATAGGADTGVSKKTAKEFIKKSHGQKVSKLPKKVKEADIPSTQGIDTKGAGLGAGRSMTTLEGAKPDYIDLDKDGNKKESMKKAAADKKKKKVDESMNHRISAARLEGKSHGLRGHAHSGKRYEDLEELKAYHEGYKEGLDECYGQGVYETAMPATVPGMASQAMPAMEDEMEEGNAFTAALAKTPKGGKFSVGGKTFTDRTSYDAKVNEYAFESLDKQLNALLNESEEVTEGLSVSVSKGQQNSPDSVTITAQDQEAEQLLQLVKHAGLGLFGDDAAHEPSSAMSVQPSHGAPDEVGSGGVDIEVVDGSDDMLSLMQKLGGVEAAGSEDYADEEDEEQLYGNHEEDHDEPCNECGGMMEAGHSCGSKEMVDEVESEEEMEFKVSEDNAPDSDEAETSADEDAEAKEDAALAGEKEEEMNESFTFEGLLSKMDALTESEGEEDITESKDDDEDSDAEQQDYGYGHDDEGTSRAADRLINKYSDDKKGKKEKVDEWANQTGKGPGKGTDASFEQDIEFMTKMIAGGLNKPKSTGQTTVPVIAGQGERMHDHLGTVEETVDDWVKLAGIK